MTESYSSNDILFKYYTSGAQIPTNFGFLEGSKYLDLKAKDYVNKFRNWITKMPLGATYNIVVSIADKVQL